MAENKIQMPGAFGGLMRYDEEYQSRFLITPTHVVALVVVLVIFVLVLKLLFPAPTTPANAIAPGAPISPHGFALSLLNSII